ncbi:MAG TPA: DUF1501 domain-containing protein [Rhodobacteraceae bacterium]|nr:DUF1501 domain-containing protein [Paracoccaceae bacterium]
MSNEPILVVVFLRGGADGLNLISPTADVDYIAARPDSMRVLRKGDEAGIAMADMAADVDFRFHPQARGLSELYSAGELAVIHASGLTDGTRSHFDAEAKMERAAVHGSAGGWLGRWFAGQHSEGILPLLSVGTAPDSVRGARDVAVADALEDLILANGHEMAPILRQRLLQGFGQHPLIGAPIQRLVQLSSTLQGRIMDRDGSAKEYTPSVEYPESDLAISFKTIARTIKLDLGLRVATVDYGGWDTHEDQANSFGDNVDELSTSLQAFWRDLGNEAERVNVVVMSEFGRRLHSNTSGGTDHGYGNAMMVLGAGIKGGQMLGEWPGLANDALDDRADLAITTDYRHVLAGVMQQHMQAENIAELFPDFTPEPMGLYA